MSDEKKVLRRAGGQGVHEQFNFWCPGCECAHGVTRRWTITGEDTDKPTVAPSVLVFPHRAFKKGVTETEIAEARKVTPMGEPLVGITSMTPRCHLFIRDGMLIFLSDCEHAFAGRTVPMEPF